MDHSNHPIIDNSDQQPYLKPWLTANFKTPLYSRKELAIGRANERVKTTHQTQHVVELEDGYIAVNYGEYFLLFGDEPGDDVVYKAEP